MEGARGVITGAGRGIGRAIALRFAAPGYRLALAARTANELERVAEEIRARGSSALCVPMDVANLASVERGLSAALDFTDGVIDLLINNAGVFDVRPFDETSPATWYRHMGVNLNGPYHVTLRSLEGLKRSSHAHVFFVASVAARRAFPGNTAYCASKYGLRGFADALRLDLAPEGIRVSTVYPGATDTKMLDGVSGEWDRRRMNRPADVAEVLWRAWREPADVDVDDLDVPLLARD